jgi:hypothetical protein
VKEALDELREELGSDRVPLAEIVIIGARLKAAELRSERADKATARGRLARRILEGDIPGDPGAADEVRRTGWTPHV